MRREEKRRGDPARAQRRHRTEEIRIEIEEKRKGKADGIKIGNGLRVAHCFLQQLQLQVAPGRCRFCLKPAHVLASLATIFNTASRISAMLQNSEYLRFSSSTARSAPRSPL